MGRVHHELVGVQLAHAVRDGIPEARRGKCCTPNPHALRVPPTDTIPPLVVQVLLCYHQYLVVVFHSPRVNDTVVCERSTSYFLLEFDEFWTPARPTHIACKLSPRCM